MSPHNMDMNINIIVASRVGEILNIKYLSLSKLVFLFPARECDIYARYMFVSHFLMQYKQY